MPVVLRTAFLFLVVWFGGAQTVHAQETWTTLPIPIPTTADTGEKPQSKAWFHGHTWWTVLATNGTVPGGTWLLRLEPDGTWFYALQLSGNSGSRADAKVVGNVTHVLLDNSGPTLVSLEYVPAANNYQLWSVRPTATSVIVGETGTIDVDSTGRMWLATDSSTDVEVYYSDYPYTSFSGPILLATGIPLITSIKSDDIAAVTALPNNTIGVFWSNQTTKRFGFRVHEDGADPTVWLADEVPASQSANDADGIGMVDDHLNLAVAADGTLYAAVKTGYSSPSGAVIALLVRRPNPGGPGGTWDDLYYVDNIGTRPIVELNEDKETVRVFYSGAPGSVYFRESAASTISFGPRQEPMTGAFNNVTSAKDAWAGRLLILATESLVGATGVVMTTDPGLVGYWKMDEGGGTQLRDMSGWGNHADTVGSPTWVPGVNRLALDLNGTNNAIVSDQVALDITTGLTLSAWVMPAAQTDQDLISRATDSVDGYTLGLSSSGTPFLRFNNQASGNYQLSSLSPYPAGGHTWIHVAATYDGAIMRMYINGVEDNSMPAPPPIAANAVNVGIGAHSAGTRRFKGVLDDARIYNRALTALDIASLVGSGPPQANLAITKDDSVSQVYLGESLVYSIQATNVGLSAVNGATVSDVIPPQLTNVTWTCIAIGGASCGAGGSGSFNDLVNLPVGSSVAYTVNATVALTATGGPFSNTATIRATHFSDTDSSNNSAMDTDIIPIIFEAHFDTTADDFGYADDLFRGTNQPNFASGALLASGGFTGGALRVNVGGVNSLTKLNMSGGWRRSFSLGNTTPVTLSFRYQLTETPNYENDEFSQMLVSVDGVLHGLPPNDYVAQVIGTGPTTTGWQFAQIALGTFPAGTHVLALGGYNNKKTNVNESAEVRIDDVVLTAGAALAPVPPSITTHPVSVTVTAPAPASFTVIATGDAPLSYQWRLNTVNIPGAINATYAINSTLVAHSGTYDVVVTNPAGFIISAPATLVVNPPSVPPSITMQPADVTVTEGASASFTVGASGDAPLLYQWRRNTVNIPGANSATYGINPTAVTDSGTFDVVVTNAAGTATSNTATLTVLAGGGGTTLIEAHFDTTADSFAYADDLFRGTSQPSYASGALLATGGFTGGALRVAVGGVNGQTILNMSGGWQRSFSLASEALVTLSFRYQLTETPNYESDEFTQMLVKLDGVLHGVPPNDYVAQVVGGGPTTTGWQLVFINLGTLPAGTHVLALGGYNNKKTYTNESAEIRIDDVLVTQ